MDWEGTLMHDLHLNLMSWHNFKNYTLLMFYTYYRALTSIILELQDIHRYNAGILTIANGE